MWIHSDNRRADLVTGVRLGGRALLCLCAGTFALTLAVFVRAADAQRLEVEADEVSYEKGNSVVEARGGVVVTWRDNKLTAETVSYYRDQSRLLASGGLVFDSPDATLSAVSCDLDIDDEVGVLRDVTVEVKDRPGSFGGSLVQKKAGREYAIDEGHYTACVREEGREPDWELAGDDVDIELDGYSTIRRGSLKVRGVPVLYLPYAKIPTRFRRTTGLLMPNIGVSSERGFVYQQPYFWAIDKQSDATFVAAVETSRRLGTELEYRYRFDRNIDGQLEVQYFNEAIRTGGSRINSPLFDPGVTDQTIPENRALVALRHRQKVLDNVKLYADILTVTDRFYLQEIESNESGYFDRVIRKSLRYTDSEVGLMDRKRDTSYGVVATLYQLLARNVILDSDGNVIGGRDADREEEERVPQRPFDAWMSSDGTLGGLVNFKVDGAFDTFLREQGADGQRLDFEATLDRNLVSTRALRSSMWVRGRLTGYHNASQQLFDVEGAFLKQLPRWAGRGAFEAGFDARTGFARTFALSGTRGPLSGRYASLRHTLEPFARMRFTERTTEEDLPLYDGVDRIDDRTTATYGIVSRFLFRQADSDLPAELARISLEQSYNLTEEVIDDNFSDIDATLMVVPAQRLSFTGIASYNVGAASLRGALAAASLNQFTVPYMRERGSRIDAVYRYVRSSLDDFTAGGVRDTLSQGLENLEARGIVGITNVLAAGFYVRYDLQGSRFVETGGGIRLSAKCDCWNIELGVVDRVSPNELQLRLQVELRGLTPIGSSALMRTTPGLALFDRGLADALRYGW